MKKIELILEAKNNAEQEQKIAAYARIKYRLPSICAYVVEVDANRLNCLQNVEGVKAMRASSSVSC